jgi:hypothetical protein
MEIGDGVLVAAVTIAALLGLMFVLAAVESWVARQAPRPRPGRARDR